MVNVTNSRIRDLLGSLTTPQLWGGGAAILGLLVAVFAIGYAAANYKAEVKSDKVGARHETDLQRQMDKHSNERVKLENKIKEAVSKFTSAETAYTATAVDRDNALLKATFLNHYIRYFIAEKTGGADLKRAKQLFVNFVHRLWVAQEENTVDLVMGDITKTRKIRVMVEKPVIVRPFGVNRPARYEWQEKNIYERIIKVVNFSDGSSYIVPENVATEVHNRQ